MPKKKTERFMTPKKGRKFYRGVRCFQPGDKIPEAFLKDAKGQPLKFPALEEWKESTAKADEKKKADDPPPGDTDQIF